MEVRLLNHNDYEFPTAVPEHRRIHGGIMLTTGGSGSLAVAPVFGEAETSPRTALVENNVSVGDVVLFLPYEDHGYRPDAGSTLKVSMITFELVDDGELIGCLSALGTRRHFRRLTGAAHLFEFVQRQIAAGNEYALRAAEGVVEALLYRMLAECRKQPPVGRGSPVDRAMEMLFEDFTARLSTVAKHLNVSPEAIRKEFRRHFGDSPMRYFTSFRVALIKEGLETTDAPLRELAEEFGFYDEFHLSRVFKRYIGISPSEYRARHRV